MRDEVNIILSKRQKEYLPMSALEPFLMAQIINNSDTMLARPFIIGMVKEGRTFEALREFLTRNE